jgi:hypothetical protein
MEKEMTVAFLSRYQDMVQKELRKTTNIPDDTNASVTITFPFHSTLQACKLCK